LEPGKGLRNGAFVVGIGRVVGNRVVGIGRVVGAAVVGIGRAVVALVVVAVVVVVVVGGAVVTYTPTRTPLKTGCDLRYAGRESSSCSTCGTRRVNLVTNPVIPHVEQELLSLPAYLRSHPVFSGVRVARSLLFLFNKL
jgi:hypothetical protein